ncbi:hypothetical protein ACTFIV_006861 [Dictyostelium citrinum]
MGSSILEDCKVIVDKFDDLIYQIADSKMHFSCYPFARKIKHNKIIPSTMVFILYTPGYHYVHFYTFTKNQINKINNNMVKENWGIEPLLIDECNIVMLPEVIRYSCILLFNKEDDISIIKTSIDAIKGSKHPIRAFFSEYIYILLNITKFYLN